MLITILEFGQLEYLHIRDITVCFTYMYIGIIRIDGAQFVYRIRFSSQVIEDPKVLDRYLVISFKQIKQGRGMFKDRST